MKNQNQEPRKRPAFRVDRSVVIVAAMIAVGVLLISVVQMSSVNAREEEKYEAGHRQIQEMSADERERLLLKEKVFFEELSEEQRQAHRKLHQHLESDENAPALKKTLKRYNVWLATLSPYQREELREKLGKAGSAKKQLTIIADTRSKQEYDKWYRTLTINHRLQLKGLERGTPEHDSVVSEIRADQERQLASGISQSPQYTRFRGRREFRQPLRVSSAELDSILNAVAKKVDVPQMQKDSWGSMPDYQRHIEILFAAVHQCLKAEKASSPTLLDTESLTRIVAGSSIDPKRKREIFAHIGRRTHRWTLLMLLNSSAMRESFSYRRKPTEEELSKFLENLDAEDRSQIMRYLGTELDRRLKMKFYQHEFRTSPRPEVKRMREFLASLGKLPEWGKHFQPSGSSRTRFGNRNGRKPFGGERRRSGKRKSPERKSPERKQN